MLTELPSGRSIAAGRLRGVNHRIIAQGIAESRTRPPLLRSEAFLVDQALGQGLLAGVLLPGERIAQPLALRLHHDAGGKQRLHLLLERIGVEIRLFPPFLERERLLLHQAGGQRLFLLPFPPISAACSQSNSFSRMVPAASNGLSFATVSSLGGTKLL